MKMICLFACLFFAAYSLNAQNEVVGVPISPGEAFNYKSKEIKFLRVLSDSRCPKKVTCIWEGNAIILLGIFENGKFIEEKEIEVSAAGRSLPVSVFEDVSLVVHKLLPHPEAANKTGDRQYLLQFGVQPK